MKCRECEYSNETASDEHCNKCIEEETQKFENSVKAGKNDN